MARSSTSFNSETGRETPITHGIYAIRGDQEAWSEKLARFKAAEGRETVRAEMGALLFDMMQAWRAHLAEINQKDGTASMLNAKVNRVMGGYLNLLFRIVDTWPTSSDGAHALELERIQKVIEEHDSAT